MKRLLPLFSLVALVGCSLLHSPPADAGTSTVTWTNPTNNTDLSPVIDNGTDETSLTSWRIEYGTCSAPTVFGVKAGEIVRARPIGGASLTSAVLNTKSGLTCFRVLVSNLAGNEAGASGVGSRTVPSPTPNPVTNVTLAP